MGTRLLEFEEVRLVINQSVVSVEWSLHPKIEVVFPLFVLKVIFFVLIRYVIKHCLLILLLICSHMCDLTPRLTYDVYLVLSLKLGVTRSKATCYLN